MFAEIQISNALSSEMGAITSNAKADLSLMHFYLPQDLSNQLKLKQLEEREVTLADGSKRLVPYVGPVKITFKNRSCFTGAMVLGNEVLLGAIPMEDMDLVIQPLLLKVDVNPESPNVPMSVAM